jgi:hypothetical protein
MPLKGLVWNRSQKDVTLSESGKSRKSHLRNRDTTSVDGSDSAYYKRSASVDAKSRRQFLGNLISSNGPDENDRLAPSRTSTPGSRPSSSRLSRFKLRHHSSDTQLATTAQNQKDDVPPVPSFPPSK